MKSVLVWAVAAAFTSQGVETGPAQDQIAAACGASVKIDVNWASFGNDEDAMKALYKPGIAFVPQAFAEICKDAGLKAEVARQIKKVMLTQAHGAADPVIYLIKGTLHIELLWIHGAPAPDAPYVRGEIASRLRGEEAEAP